VTRQWLKHDGTDGTTVALQHYSQTLSLQPISNPNTNPNPTYPKPSPNPGMLNYAGDAGDLVIDTAAAGRRAYRRRLAVLCVLSSCGEGVEPGEVACPLPRIIS